MRAWLPIFAASLIAAAPLPPIPPLPASQVPDARVAEPFARDLIAQVSATDLAQSLSDHPDLIPAILRNLGTAIMSGDPKLSQSVASYLTKLARATKTADLQQLTALAVIDPQRYGDNEFFRARVNQSLASRIAALPAGKRRAVFDEIERSTDLDYATSESAAIAIGAANRSSARRRIAFNHKIRTPDDITGPIEASIYSLSTRFFTPAEATLFIDAVHASAPQRRIVVLGDAAMRTALKNVAFVDDQSRGFTPWPRDPFIAARTKNSVVFINRPNAQPHREDDQNMVRAIIAGLPPKVDATWNTRWTVAPYPFHNGHILLTPKTVWISMHTVEPRVLAMLGLDHVPTETFGDARAVERYFEAVRRAATELEAFYGRRVRFVHPLDASHLDALIGGAGFDLDSIVTILPGAALVGDISLGTSAARRSPVAEWTAFQRAYLLRGDRNAIVDSQRLPRTVALQAFLDEVAAELERDGFAVRRLPLLNVPTSFVARDDVPQDKDFLITWNNVVLEGRKAEGFASLLTSIDDDVRKAFATSGFKLVLFPPLTHSIVLGGGYRCASNHIRPR